MFSILLKDIAHRDNFSIHSNASVRDVIKLMKTNRMGVIVLLEEQKPIGILTERDIVEILYKGFDMDETANKFSKKVLITTNGNRQIGYALNLMIENNIRRVVVTDDSNCFLGVITQQDLLVHLEEDFYRSTIRVKHILAKLGYLIGVPPHESLSNVLGKMVKNKISSLAVIKDEVAVGIVTEKDILDLASKNVGLESEVSHYMTSPVISASLDVALTDIVKMMNDKNIRRIIIVNGEGAAVNILTIRDVLRNLEGDYNKFLERKLRNAKEILNLLPEMMMEVADTGKEHLIIWANEKIINKFGRKILDTPITDFIPKKRWDKICATIHDLKKIENIKLKKDDGIYELSGIFIHTEGRTEKGRFQLIMKDITEDVRLSTVDPLTSVYNRRFINEFLMKEIERSKRSKNNFSIVMCDIDDFKVINDKYGHASGDSVLRFTSQYIIDSLRNSDVIGRYGGDEFVIILPETTHEGASKIIEKIKLSLAGSEIPIVKGRIKVSVSFGIASFPDDGITSDDLLVASDERMYKEKSLGKQRTRGHVTTAP
jgi:diguanylate cyclase (GGDEF)-like protein